MHQHILIKIADNLCTFSCSKMYSMMDLCFVWIVSLTMSMNVAKCENRTDLGFTQETNVTIAVFAPEIDGYDFSLSNIIPAVELAVEEQTKKLPKNIRLRVTYHDSHYGQEYPLEVDAIRLIDSHKAQVFIGPIGDAALNHVARISAHENFPIISPGGLHINFGLNKTDYVIYQTLIRIGPKFNRLIGMLIHVLVNVFSFQKIKIISQKHNAQNTNLCKAVHDTALDLHKLDYDTCKNFHENIDYLLNLFKNKHSGNSSNIQFDFYLIPKRMNVTDILVNEIGTNYGVVVLCASADSVREIMIKAHELNFDNGEYVFFSIDLFSSKNESTKPWYRENDTQERNEKAKKAYEALMTVTLRKPTSPEYKNFSREVKRRAKSRYENFTYGEEEVNSFVGAFHDAVILYALALNETLQANRSITNGTEITRRMWNRTFRGITGNVSIDDNGDRNADYSLLDMDPVTGEFEVVANYFGNTKRYEQVDGKSIRWAGGLDRAPPDTPKCGFDNSKCPPDKPFPEYGIVIIVLGSLLLIVVVAAFFIYRHIKLEAELAEMNWRVKWEDIMLGTIEGERKMKKQAASNLSLARTEDSSMEGQFLIERTPPPVTPMCCIWCKCGQCDVAEKNRRVCCRHIDKLEDRLESERCITATKDFQDVVLNAQVLLTVYIHVMLARRHRGSAPTSLTPYKQRLMATRQFLCWLHSGEVLERQTKWAIPACVIRAIKLWFPEVGAEMTSGDDACSLTLEDILPLENHSSV